MDIQFAFGNPTSPKSKRKKRVAKSGKVSKLKRVRVKTHKSTVKRGSALAKKKRSKKSKHHKGSSKRRKHSAPKSIHKKGHHKTRRNPSKKRHHKRRKNPAQWVYTKKGMKKEKSPVFGNSTDMKKLQTRYRHAERKLDAAIAEKNASAAAKFDKEMKAIRARVEKLKGIEYQASTDARGYQASGWKATYKSWRKGKKKGGKKGKKAKGGSVAKKGKSKKGKSKKGKSKRKSVKRKGGYHRHRSRSTKHYSSKRQTVINKGTVFTGKLRSKGRKGRKRHHASFRLKILNPIGGDRMNASMKEWLGHDVEDASALAIGGALYGTVNGMIAKYIPAVSSMANSVPVVGPAILPLVLGAVIHKYLGNSKAGRMVGEGLVGASIVGMGVVAGASLSHSLGLSGVFYTPLSGPINPQLGAVKYYPMSGIPRGMPGGVGSVKYYPMSGYPQLGKDPDFGRHTDYGGSGGYTEAHKFSSADFGQADDGTDTSGAGAAEAEDDYNEIVDNMGMG